MSERVNDPTIPTLKSCPFCGYPPFVVRPGEERPKWIIECAGYLKDPALVNCPCPEVEHEDITIAAQFWNRRSGEGAPHQLTEDEVRAFLEMTPDLQASIAERLQIAHKPICVGYETLRILAREGAIFNLIAADDLYGTTPAPEETPEMKAFVAAARGLANNWRELAAAWKEGCPMSGANIKEQVACERKFRDSYRALIESEERRP